LRHLFPIRTEIQELKDRFALWLLLSELKKNGMVTQKLKLQKLVYLSDIFGTVFARKPTNYTFIVYDLGPFSKEVTTDMDLLVSKGIVDSEEIKLWDPEHERSFDYRVRELRLEDRNRVVNKLELGLLEKAIGFTVRVAGNLDSEGIRQLVYTEPNYLAAKKIGYKSVINPDYRFAADFRESARRISADEYSLDLDEEQIGLLYLRYMKSHNFNLR
jgi:hypothetical protein